MRSARAISVVMAGVLLVACGNLVKNGALVEAQQALDAGAYADALESTDIAESFGELSVAETAKLHYLRARSLEGLGRRDEAIALYRYVVKQHANSAYAELSRRALATLSSE